MYTFICIIFSFIVIGIMTEMSNDYNINNNYYIPCIMVLILCMLHIVKVIIKCNKETYYDDNNQYFNDYYRNYGYSKKKKNKFYHNKEVIKKVKNKCKRNFNISIE